MDRMEIEQYFEETTAGENIFNADDNFSPDKWKSISDRVIESDDTSGFDCNICLDSVQDPVVTLCGHLYCWPCIYKWLHFQSMSTEFDQQQCPVCKSDVSEDTLVPLFGRGNCTKSSRSKAPNLGIIIPQRPRGLACGFGSPRSPVSPTTLHPNQPAYQRNYPYELQPDYTLQGSRLGTMTRMSNPAFGMLGEMIYARVFGSSVTNLYTYPNSYNLAGSTSPRVRRHLMQADKSLSRISLPFLLRLLVFSPILEQTLLSALHVNMMYTCKNMICTKSFQDQPDD